LLALVRRPSRQIYNVKMLGSARIGEARYGVHQNIAAQGRGAVFQNAGFSHAAQISQQLVRGVISHGDFVDVGDRQGKTCALQRSAIIANPGQG